MEIESKSKIELSEEEFKEFYENFGSSNFKLQSDIFKDIGDRQVDIYFKSIGFATTIIGAVGIIAGFGFTALGYVQNVLLFFIGEGLLSATIFYGLFWTQQKYQQEFNSLEEDRKKYLDYYNQRNKKFIELYESWLSQRNIDRSKFLELNDIDKKSIDLFKTENQRVAPDIYSRKMYILMIIGIVFLFSSFIIVDFFKLLSL